MMIRTDAAKVDRVPPVLTDGTARPRILYERHIFSRQTSGRFDRDNRPLSGPDWDRRWYAGGAGEYPRLAGAMLLDYDAALGAASWGLPQILGVNFKAAGFRSVRAFVEAMYDGEPAHLGAFVSFLEFHKLDRRLVLGDLPGYARGFNGPGFAANGYVEKLRANIVKARGLPPENRPISAMMRMGGDNDPDEVRRVQQALLHAGSNSIVVDGVYGPATQASVQLFQQRHRLQPDGVVGPATRKALGL